MQAQGGSFLLACTGDDDASGTMEIVPAPGAPCQRRLPAALLAGVLRLSGQRMFHVAQEQPCAY